MPKMVPHLTSTMVLLEQPRRARDLLAARAVVPTNMALMRRKLAARLKSAGMVAMGDCRADKTANSRAAAAALRLAALPAKAQTDLFELLWLDNMKIAILNGAEVANIIEVSEGNLPPWLSKMDWREATEADKVPDRANDPDPLAELLAVLADQIPDEAKRTTARELVDKVKRGRK